MICSDFSITIMSYEQGMFGDIILVSSDSLCVQKMFEFRQDTKTLPEHRITDIRAAL